MKKMSIAITILVLFVFQIQPVEANNLVVNGSFETSINTVTGPPTSFGTWNALDYATTVETQTNIIPLEGSRMLKFINSGGSGASSFGACDVWQLIDVSSYSSLIASGKAAATASTNYNRVAGDQETDTAFLIELYAFSGSPGSFHSQLTNNTYIGNTSRLIFTDDDLDTWQKVDAELPLPQNTNFLAIHIASIENIKNDVSGIEFDGHYADNVKVFIQTKTEMPTFFEDNFNDGILDGWTVGTTDVGNVAIESGELSCSGEWANSAWPTSLVIDDFTLEYDMKIISASGTTETYFRADNLSATIPNGYMFSVRNSNGIALYKWDNNKWITLETAGFQCTLNNWYHFKILAVEDQLQVYIDGVKKIDITDTTYSSGNIRLGSWQDPSFGWTNEHVHWDNFQLTAEATTPDLTNGLAAYWSFNDQSDPGHDDSGNGNNGTVYGDGDEWIPSGVCGGALSFDGIDDYVDIPYDISMEFSGNAAVEAWVKPSSFTGERIIFIKTIEPDYWGIFLGMATDKPRVAVVIANTQYTLTSDNSIELNNWHHLVGVREGTILKLFTDGVFDKEMDIPSGALRTGVTKSRIGRAQIPQKISFNGTIDNVAVYNRALSVEEIQQHYQNGLQCTKYHSLMIASNYEFSLQESSEKTFSLQISNQDSALHLASLAILNPYDDLIATLSQGSVSLEPGESKEIPITIDAASVAAGTYDIQIKVTDDEGNISYSNIKIYVTANGEENLPNLNVSSPDISFSKLNPEQDETINLSALIHNQGNSPAANISVEFYDFGNLLGKVTIESLNANALEIASTSVSFSSAGSHLIRVVVDPLNDIVELDESDNEASQILQVGSEPDITGNILVTGGLPSTVVANSLFKVTGHATYEIYINGDRNTDYDVKGGTVQITIKGDGGSEWIYPGIYTDINGNFSKLLQAPEDAGTYQIIMTVTDKTFTGTRNLFFEVIAQSPPTPPSPPTSSGSGTWNYDSSGGGWTWEWTQLPVHEPILESNLYVHSEDIYFSKNNPALGDEISIITEIHYWSSSTAITAENVPVNFYVTYPGFPKMKIGETTIQNISVGEPDLGSSHVFVSWKNQAEGIYIVEVEIDPEYIEENQFDNAATRAIIVGQVALGDYGVISGHVTNPWGGVGGVFIDLFDSDGTFLSNTVTDETGGYLFADIPAAGYTVQIILPDGYSADAETKTTTVSSNAISAVNFKITDIKGPITTDAATDLNPVQIGDTVNLSAFVDDTNTGESDILSAEYSLGGGETWIPMDTVDGSFDSPSEWVTSTFPVPGVPGVYELCVRGTDSYENIGPEECFLLVVYDPEGGFVTGGGWIWSPPGAYADDISLEGKANFGFVSKYKKGAEVPTGHTEFQFKTADLNFHSDSYEWLVVTGSNYAKFKGKGTINGDYDPNGNLYKFMLWAGDDVPDTFRIRIWWEEEGDGTEHDVYDNGFDQAITGGSIVIHTKEK